MAKAKKKSQDSKSDISFEDALVELQQIVSDLETGSLGLDESLTRFEQGMGLLKECHQLLEQAEKRVQILTGVDADGEPLTEDFDDQRSDAQSDADTSPKAGRRPSSRRKKQLEDTDESQLF